MSTQKTNSHTNRTKKGVVHQHEQPVSAQRKAIGRLAIHPVHFHLGMYVAIAALLVTVTKTSENAIASISHAPGAGHVNVTMLTNTHMREAETHTGHARFNFARPARVSGS